MQANRSGAASWLKSRFLLPSLDVVWHYCFHLLKDSANFAIAFGVSALRLFRTFIGISCLISSHPEVAAFSTVS